ncbi:MAG: hypothetical protein FWD96_06425 [Defluviitaleaceae bacterium]|nr:hypothetical protein [Defluviitaleaceae bacterium]
MSTKTYIISGFTGSGKSEFAVNLALHLRSQPQTGRVTIADLDVINPYFRSREKARQLGEFNIEVFGGALGNNTGQDVPHLNYGFTSRIANGECVIVDLAGGVLGVNTLANVYAHLREHEFLVVLNLYRPETSSPAKMLTFIEQLREKSRIPITGLVNNSHMLRQTQPQHILDAQAAINEVSQATGLPIHYTLLSQQIYEQLPEPISFNEVLTFNTLQLREPWQ